MGFKKPAISFLALTLAGCASSSNEIQTAYVSPLLYKDYDCDQIAMELQRVTTRASELGGQIDENASGDAVAMGVGLVLFWPALFFIDGDGPEANEYARLKGEKDALEQVAIEKKCFAKTPETSSASQADSAAAVQAAPGAQSASPVPEAPASAPQVTAAPAPDAPAWSGTWRDKDSNGEHSIELVIRDGQAEVTVNGIGVNATFKGQLDAEGRLSINGRLGNSPSGKFTLEGQFPTFAATAVSAQSTWSPESTTNATLTVTRL